MQWLLALGTAAWIVEKAHHAEEAGSAPLPWRAAPADPPSLAARRARMLRCTSGGSCGSRSVCWSLPVNAWQHARVRIVTVQYSGCLLQLEIWPHAKSECADGAGWDAPRC